MRVKRRRYPSGKWSWEFMLTPKETGGKMKKKCGFQTREDAKTAGEALLKQLKLRNGKYIIDIDKSTYEELHNIFMHQARMSYSLGTIKNYDGLFKNHFSTLKERKISDITPLFLDYWLKEKELNGKSVYLINDCIKLVSAVFHYCENKRVIPIGFFGPIKKLKEVKIARNRIELEDLRSISTICRERLPLYYPIFILSVFSGMRLGEYSNITVDDINFSAGTIKVEKQYTMRILKDKTKTAKSKRVVHVPKFVLSVLRRHIEQQGIQKGLLFKALRPNKKTIERNKGKEIPISPNWINARFHDLLEIYFNNRKYMRVHDLRGEFVDLARVSGMSMEYISGEVGHARPSTTWNMYSEIFNEEAKEAQQKMQELFANVTF